MLKSVRRRLRSDFLSLEAFGARRVGGVCECVYVWTLDVEAAMTLKTTEVKH